MVGLTAAVTIAIPALAPLRPAYIAVSGTLSGLLALLPILGGWIADVGSPRLVFWTALGFAALAMASSMRLACLRRPE